MAQEVKIGQVWEDADKRQAGSRRLRVVGISVAGQRVICQVWFRTGSGEWELRRRGGLSKIRLDRFRPTSTGYRLVETDSL